MGSVGKPGGSFIYVQLHLDDYDDARLLCIHNEAAVGKLKVAAKCAYIDVGVSLPVANSHFSPECFQYPFY